MLYVYTKMFYVPRKFLANKLEKYHPLISLYYIYIKKYNLVMILVYGENNSKKFSSMKWLSRTKL